MFAVDSLPYYDQAPSEEERDAVDALVAKETPSHTRLHPSIPDHGDWSPSSGLIQQELERVGRGEKLQATDLSRYEDVEAPESRDLKDWRSAFRRNVVAASCMSGRGDNLALMKLLGQNAWTMHVYQLEYKLKTMEAELMAARQETELINADRKKAQLSAGARLSELDEKWRALVSGNLETSVACAVLEQEIQDLQESIVI